jgi:hypothetical protein
MLAALALGLAAPGAAARIKLAALPERERVEIQLDNGRATLVEEERIVPLLRGSNQIDFSWSNTAVDKDSIQFRPIGVREGDGFRPLREVDGRPEVQVVNAAYPPNENALVWEVHAHEACAARVRVSYLVSNLGRAFAYRALANKAETHLTLRKYLHLVNDSGEDFGGASVWAGFGPQFQKPVGQSNEIRMLLDAFASVPIRKTYTFDWYTHGPLDPDKPYASRVLMHYELRNDAANAMGRFPLQPGKVRIFIEDGRGGEAFLGEDWAALTPIDGEMRLYLGEARDVVCTRTIQDNRRHPVRGNLFDQEIRIRYEVENFKSGEAVLDVVEQLNRLAQEYGADPKGDVEWVLGADTTAGVEIGTELGRATPVLRLPPPPPPPGPPPHGG